MLRLVCMIILILPNFALAELRSLHCGYSIDKNSPYQQLADLQNKWQIFDTQLEIQTFNELLLSQQATNLNTFSLRANTWKKKGDEFVRSISLPNGIQYEGDVAFGKFHGRGRLTAPSGEKYVGLFENGIFKGTGFVVLKSDKGEKYIGDVWHFKPSGEAIFHSASGIRVNGEFIDGILHGNGEIHSDTGSSLKGNFKNGLADGEVIFITESGTEHLSKSWDSGQIMGFSEINYAEGSNYSGYVRGLAKSGQGTFVAKSGNIFNSDNWYCDVIKGQGVIQYASGAKYEGEIGEGSIKGGLQRNGNGTLVYPNGSYKRGIWVNNKLQGTGQQFIVSNDAEFIYKGEFIDSEWSTGEFTDLTADYRYSGGFSNRRPHGYGELFASGEEMYLDPLIAKNVLGEDIRYERKGNWRNGEFTGQGQHHEYGTLGSYLSEGKYLKGNLDGSGEIHARGVIQTEVFYKHLKRLLPYLKEFSSEQPSFVEKGTYKAGQPLDVIINWDNDITVEENRSSELYPLIFEIATPIGRSFFWGEEFFDEKDALKKEYFKSPFYFSGLAKIVQENNTTYYGQILKDEKHGFGVSQLKPQNAASQIREVFVGIWADGKRSDVGITVNLETQKVKRCKLGSQGALTCINNSFLEWYIPIRQRFGFADYGAPKLKDAVDRLTVAQRKKLNIQPWSFETYIELLMRSAILVGSIDLNLESTIQKLLDYDSVKQKQVVHFNHIAELVLTSSN